MLRLPGVWTDRFITHHAWLTNIEDVYSRAKNGAEMQQWPYQEVETFWKNLLHSQIQGCLALQAIIQYQKQDLVLHTCLHDI